MRTAALLLPLALAATFTSAPLLAASASSPAPATAKARRLLAPSTRTTALPGLVANNASLPSGATTGTSARRG